MAQVVVDKALDKVVRFLECYTHCSKYNGKLFVRASNLCLTCYLRSKLCMAVSSQRPATLTQQAMAELIRTTLQALYRSPP